jgi:hypothetical protein
MQIKDRRMDFHDELTSLIRCNPLGILHNMILYYLKLICLECVMDALASSILSKTEVFEISVISEGNGSLILRNGWAKDGWDTCCSTSRTLQLYNKVVI